MSKRKVCALFTILLMLISGCQQYQIPRELPLRDITFQVGYPSDEMTGFVNVDGSGLEIIPSDNYVRKPSWSSDGLILFGLVNYRIHQSNTSGYPAYWEEQDGLNICGEYPGVDQIESTKNPTNPYEVYISHVDHTILVLDLSTCTVTSTVVNTNNGTWCEVLGISYSRERDELVYGVSSCDIYHPMTYQLILLEMDTGKETFLGEGFYPQWSPDSTQIAYVGVDGLYLMDPDGVNQRQLLTHIFVDHNRWIGGIVPLPRWTPDGEWLLYHRCGQCDCTIPNNSIYRFSILSGQEEKIVDGGAYPTWRP